MDSIFRLPLELRVIIYEHVLAPECDQLGVCTYHPHGTGLDVFFDKRRKHICRASRRLRADVLTFINAPTYSVYGLSHLRRLYPFRAGQSMPLPRKLVLNTDADEDCIILTRLVLHHARRSSGPKHLWININLQAGKVDIDRFTPRRSLLAKLEDVLRLGLLSPPLDNPLESVVVKVEPETSEN